MLEPTQHRARDLIQYSPNTHRRFGAPSAPRQRLFGVGNRIKASALPDPLLTTRFTRLKAPLTVWNYALLHPSIKETAVRARFRCRKIAFASAAHCSPTTFSALLWWISGLSELDFVPSYNLKTHAIVAATVQERCCSPS